MATEHDNFAHSLAQAREAITDPHDRLLVFMTRIEANPLFASISPDERAAAETMILGVQPEVYQWNNLVDVCLWATFHYLEEMGNHYLAQRMADSNLLFIEDIDLDPAPIVRQRHALSANLD